MKKRSAYLPPEVDVVTVIPQTDFCSSPVNSNSQDYEYDDDYSLS